jgi:hypothetical protein
LAYQVAVIIVNYLNGGFNTVEVLKTLKIIIFNFKHCFHKILTEDYRWETVPVPRPGPNELLVKVAAVGICAGDAKCFSGADRFWGKVNSTHMVKYISGWVNNVFRSTHEHRKLTLFKLGSISTRLKIIFVNNTDTLDLILKFYLIFLTPLGCLTRKNNFFDFNPFNQVKEAWIFEYELLTILSNETNENNFKFQPNPATWNLR